MGGAGGKKDMAILAETDCLKALGPRELMNKKMCIQHILHPAPSLLSAIVRQVGATVDKGDAS